MARTPHCQRFCGTDWKGREYHYHSNAKLQRGRKGRNHTLRDAGMGVQTEREWHDHRGAVRAAERAFARQYEL